MDKECLVRLLKNKDYLTLIDFLEATHEADFKSIKELYPMKKDTPLFQGRDISVMLVKLIESLRGNEEMMEKIDEHNTPNEIKEIGFN